MQLHFGSRKALVHACRASSIINPRPSPRSWRMLPPPALMFITFVSILVFLPWSVALPSVFFNLESIDIQPMDDQGSLLRVCAEYHASNVTLAQGIAAVKLHFSPDGPSATSYAPSDALCVHGVERGGRYRAQIMLIDDRDGSELNVQSPPPGASSMFEMLFGWHSDAAITAPSHGSIIFSASPQVPVAICHRTHVSIPHLQPSSLEGGLQLDSPFAAFVLSINGRPISIGNGASASRSCTTAHPGWGRHSAVLEWFSIAEEWQPWWEQQQAAHGASPPQLLGSTEVNRALHACCSAMGSLLAFCSESFKFRHGNLVAADVTDCPFIHASGTTSVVFSVADSAAPMPPLLQQLLVAGQYVDAGHSFAAPTFSAADAAVYSAIPIIEAFAGNFSRCLKPLRRFVIAALPQSPTESFFNPCVVKSRDGTFRFTARAHDLSDKFLLTRRKSRVIAGMLAADGRAVSERALLHGSNLTVHATGIHNISVTGFGNPPPFCSPGEQDARVLVPEDVDGCSYMFMFAPHRHLPSRGGIAAVRHCWPLLHSDAAAASNKEASAQPQELQFIWLSHSPIEKNWPIWRADPDSDSACSSNRDPMSCNLNADPTAPRFLFARSIEPHDIFAVSMEAQAEGVAGGVVSHVASTSAGTLKWFHDNTPFWIHGGSPPVEVPYSISCVASREPCGRSSNSTIMIAVGHAKDPFTFTYVNFLYAFSPLPPYAVLGWVPLNLDARVTMGMCLQPLDDSRSLLLSFGHSDKSMRMALYDTDVSLQIMPGETISLRAQACRAQHFIWIDQK